MPAILVILGSRRGDRGSVYQILLECVRAGTLHLETVRATIGVPALDTQSQPASAPQLLDMSYTPIWLALIDSLGRNASAGEERVAAAIVTTAPVPEAMGESYKYTFDATRMALHRMYDSTCTSTSWDLQKMLSTLSVPAQQPKWQNTK